VDGQDIYQKARSLALHVPLLSNSTDMFYSLGPWLLLPSTVAFVVDYA